MSIAIGPLTRLFTKNMHVFIESSYSWDSLRLISFDLKAELLFWRSNLSRCNGLSMTINTQVNKIVYSDASETGYGGYIVHIFDEIIAKGQFNPEEKGTSSTYRELLAVKHILESFKSHLENQRVQWFSDNLNVTRNHLQTLALDIYNICFINNIILYPAWIPRELNKIADKFSKEIDTDNWSIDNETFCYIESIYGIFTVDRFSDDKNKKVKLFNSKYYCPRSGEINCFAFNWNNNFNWLCPPIYLIGKTIKHLRLCKGKGVLFIPLWKSAYFWPLLTTDGINFNSFVKHHLILDPYLMNFANLSDSVFDGFAKFYSLCFITRFFITIVNCFYIIQNNKMMYQINLCLVLSCSCEVKC